MGLFGLTSLDLVSSRDDVYGALARKTRRLDLVSEVLVGDLGDQASDYWREQADRVEDAGLADRLRSIAALVEAADLL